LIFKKKFQICDGWLALYPGLLTCPSICHLQY